MVKLGQAPALNRPQWYLWEKFVGQHAGARMAAIIALTGRLGLRTGEALALQKKDVQLNGTIPRITIAGQEQGNRKSPGEVYIRQKDITFVKQFMSGKLKFDRCKKHKHGKGRGKTIKVEDTFTVPASGYLFASRKKAKSKHLHYQAVYTVVKKLAPKFLSHLRQLHYPWTESIAKLRPHSGRATLITELMGQGLSTAMSMKYALDSQSF